MDRAVQAGKLPPAHREFYLREATRDLDAARSVINALPVRVSPGESRGPAPQRRPLTEAEESICRQLGLSAEAFINAAD